MMTQGLAGQIGSSSFNASAAAEPRVFAEPWEARAFALALVLIERGMFTAKDFQAALIARIEAFEKRASIVDDGAYYTRWVEALDDLLTARHLVSAHRLSDVEAELVAEAATRKGHQHISARDDNGRLRIAPLIVDPGSLAS